MSCSLLLLSIEAEEKNDAEHVLLSFFQFKLRFCHRHIAHQWLGSPRVFRHKSL